jgi:hypothetical protein
MAGGYDPHARTGGGGSHLVATTSGRAPIGDGRSAPRKGLQSTCTLCGKTLRAPTVSGAVTAPEDPQGRSADFHSGQSRAPAVGHRRQAPRGATRIDPMIQIAVINESSAVADADVQAMLPAFQTQWTRDLAPIWGLEDAQFVWSPKEQTPPAMSWWVVFLDDSDQAGALAYHDVTDQGLPLSKVFAKTIKADGTSLSVGATHEICEMAVDPTINLAAQDTQGTFWAYEVCDPVEDDQYGYSINGVLVTDFVTPGWFGFKNSSGPLDFKQHASEPFVILSGGYAQKFGKNGWQQVNGKEAEARGIARVLSAPKGSRRRRRDKARAEWEKSKPMAERAGLRATYRSAGRK